MMNEAGQIVWINIKGDIKEKIIDIWKL